MALMRNLIAMLNPRVHHYLAFFVLCALSTATQASTDRYEIDSKQSQLYWLVYSAGALARFGHNHVISVTDMVGEVSVQYPLHQAKFLLKIPVSGLEVDSQVLRSQLGQAFDSQPSQADIEATRQNMLSQSVLDQDQYPLINISGGVLLDQLETQTLGLALDMRGNTIDLVLPVIVTIDEDSIVVEAEFQLTHNMLGLRPFSALFGGLRVAEQMDFYCRIVARRVN